MENEIQRRQVQSVDRALRVLECVADHTNGVSLVDISRILSLNKNTVFQLLSTLCANGYLAQENDTKNYVLGSKLALLSNTNNFYMDLIRRARPTLELLSAETNETAHIAVMNNAYVRFLDKVEPKQSLCVVTNLDIQVPIHNSSVGKVMLGCLTDEQLSKLLPNIIYSPHTPNSIMSEDELLVELTKIRSNGYSIDDEEFYIGVRCVAAAVTDGKGAPVCALGISAPLQRMPAFEPYAQIVKQIAENLRYELGYIHR